VLYVFAKPRETPLADSFVLETTTNVDPAPFTLLSRLDQKGGDGVPGLDRLDIAAECLDHMVAGIDTTGDALSFLMWGLSQPDRLPIQRRPQEELRNNPGANFDALPFLDAVVMEGLRCWPAIPMSLPRYVPAGGRTIDGYFIPEHTIVSCQAYSVHRLDTAIFPDPDKFDPNRWLQKDGDADRKRLFFAFSSGGRGCVGKQYANSCFLPVDTVD
jgi:cytochrome P450